MTEAIVVALITGALPLAGTVITVLATTKKTNQRFQVSQAVTDEKLTELTREVREHNHFARRMPVVEEQIKILDRRLAVAEARLDTGKETRI